MRHRCLRLLQAWKLQPKLSLLIGITYRYRRPKIRNEGWK
uniref:Uncharacterized protein n=1 Tax=Arundo donax TaxID=35708 RepID=A0A0A8YEF4_ARUDO